MLELVVGAVLNGAFLGLGWWARGRWEAVLPPLEELAAGPRLVDAVPLRTSAGGVEDRPDVAPVARVYAVRVVRESDGCVMETHYEGRSVSDALADRERVKRVLGGRREGMVVQMYRDGEAMGDPSSLGERNGTDH